MKAIFEMEMPKSCTTCDISFTTERIKGLEVRMCPLTKIWIDMNEYSDTRAPFCSLIPSEQKENQGGTP